MSPAVWVLLGCLAWTVGSVAVGLLVGQAIARADRHSCQAPCAVRLPAGTLEDAWDFDYGWKDEHTPVVGVWAKGDKR